MTLLYIVAIAVVAVIVAIAVLYAVVFGVMAVGVLFGVKVAWKKRKFFVGLIPDEEISAPDFAAGVVEAGIRSAVNTVQQLKKSKNEHNVPEVPASALIDQQTSAKAEVIRPRRIAVKRKRPEL